MGFVEATVASLTPVTKRTSGFRSFVKANGRQYRLIHAGLIRLFFILSIFGLGNHVHIGVGNRPV